VRWGSRAKSNGFSYAWEVALILMLAVIRPIVFTFLRSKAIKQLALDIIKAAVRRTDNDVDDRLAEMLEKALFPGRPTS